MRTAYWISMIPLIVDELFIPLIWSIEKNRETVDVRLRPVIRVQRDESYMTWAFVGTMTIAHLDCTCTITSGIIAYSFW